MLIRKTNSIDAFAAGDETLLKEIINPATAGAKVRYSLAHALVKPGQTTLPHRLKSSESYYVLQGEGEVSINNEIAMLGVGDLVYIPPRALQCIRNTGTTDLVFLCICDPSWRKEDEVIE
ncbi:cupin domain-containing protein [Roseimarinus sediminis]|jgi:mannose-6-phosphate isomerase-like protein (cupin superfamily)|uniref:cupin domain-containing protein n=1 Tax=Roseimarinus sediminis TaxID=1610899 RepID=UPI003D1C0B80